MRKEKKSNNSSLTCFFSLYFFALPQDDLAKNIYIFFEEEDIIRRNKIEFKICFVIIICEEFHLKNIDSGFWSSFSRNMNQKMWSRNMNKYYFVCLVEQRLLCMFCVFFRGWKNSKTSPPNKYVCFGFWRTPLNYRNI